MSKLTLKDIAQHFGVSVSTVSKAINDSHEISSGLKARIQEYATRNRYRPNKLALNLINNNSKIIGVVIPNILNHFFVQVLYGIEKIADANGYNLITCITNHSLEKEIKTLEVLSSGSVDGLIISSVVEESKLQEHAQHFEGFTKNQIPMVMFDRVLDSITCDKVVVDDVEAGYKATKYFIEIGCTTIAIINPIADLVIGKQRIDGYTKALQEHKIPFDEKLMMAVGPEDDLDLSLSFLLNHRKIDAILVLNELMAVQVMEIVKARGYHVPDDISIIGFTNGQLSKYVSPSLSSISQHGAYIGETAARILIDKIENELKKLYSETKVVKTSLIVRNSTLKLDR